MAWSRRRQNLAAVACLALPLGATAALVVDHVTEPPISGSAIVTLDMTRELCSNPKIEVAGIRWHTDETLGRAEAGEDGRVTGRFTWDGDRAEFDIGERTLDYGRDDQRFPNMSCAIG